MNELTIKKEQIIDNNNIVIEKLLKDFYESIDVDDETIKTYKTGIKNFLNWIKDNEINQIDKKTMISYKNYLLSEFKPTTATTYLSGVRNLFNFLEELGIPNVMRNIKGIKVPKDFKRQPLTREQVLKMMKDKSNNLETLQDYRDNAIYNLLVRNGLRTIELSRANIDDLKQVGGQYILKIQGKGQTDKTQTAVLKDGALVPLLTYLDKRGKDNFQPLFIGLATNKYGSRLTTRSIRRIIKGMFIHNGYISDTITTHSLRHTALTFALKGGASLQETKELGRHSDINTTLIYSHNIERIENAPEQYIENYLKGEKKENEK